VFLAVYFCGAIEPPKSRPPLLAVESISTSVKALLSLGRRLY
jgi:hypothetical protein